MRTGAAAGYEGYLHETALYRSDNELVGVARPFLREGIEAGEHVLVSCGERTTELLRRAVGTPPAMTFRPEEETMRRPAS